MHCWDMAESFVFNHNLFSNACSSFRADRHYTDFNLTRGDGVLIAVHHSISGCIWKYDLEVTNECVWIEIPVNDGFSSHVVNQYF
jgi:hypothetical protein